jgi:hypothetical protein
MERMDKEKQLNLFDEGQKKENTKRPYEELEKLMFKDKKIIQRANKVKYFKNKRFI